MKTVLKAGVALSLSAFVVTGNAIAQTEQDPSRGTALQPPPGIIMTPPLAPSVDSQQSCPATGQKLELIS